jgi:hypothetical protein
MIFPKGLSKLCQSSSAEMFAATGPTELFHFLEISAAGIEKMSKEEEGRGYRLSETTYG